MARFLNTIGKANLAIAVCARCNFKVANADLRRDPDSRMMVCEGCIDAPDPWQLPARIPDRIALPFVQADAPIGNLPGPAAPALDDGSTGDFGPDFGPDFS